MHLRIRVCFFFFNDTATTEIYTLSLHDALPISAVGLQVDEQQRGGSERSGAGGERPLHGGGDRAGPDTLDLQLHLDRKSTRLNSSHDQISYAVFCLKKKK